MGLPTRSHARALALATLATCVAAPAAAQPGHRMQTEEGFYFFVDHVPGEYGDDPNQGTGALLSVFGSDTRTLELGVRSDGSRFWYRQDGTATTFSLGDRQIDLPDVRSGVVQIRRSVFVPEEGPSIARIVDVITNTSDEPLAITLDEVVPANQLATSSGDTMVDTDDAWSVSGFSWIEEMTGLVWGSASPPVPGVITREGFLRMISRTVRIGPGERVVLVRFATKSRTLEGARDLALQVLSGPPPEVMVGMDELIPDVINFDWVVPGAPRVQIEAATIVPEGAAIPVRATALPADVTWSWDVTGTGELVPMGTTREVSVPADALDGPDLIRVGAEATADGRSTRRYWMIRVENVAPSFVDLPERLELRVGEAHELVLRAQDPSPLDRTSFELVSAPEGVTLERDRVRMRPTEAQITRGGRELIIAVRVIDDDGGATDASIALAVRPNRAPSVPIPIAPVPGSSIEDRTPDLVVSNAIDDDGDTLRYELEIDTSPDFDAPMRVADLPSGTAVTSWPVPEALAPGSYVWRVRVTDGAFTSDWATASFRVSAPRDAGAPADASAPPPTERSSGCAVGGGARIRGNALLLVLGAMIVIRARRRRLQR
ncbi:hypothetical protein [Sandaracinus amylolyticus]|uniref:Internalin n=1 Tax=Sandaracinus amylolyticus TaxID=927083 RepID=A0A0F6W1M4_9BACT|nr:hypothetical protein [Sandaracinus amylolyticus]AKF04946.1 internalin [Sandaracinus amylolyticus]